MKRLADAAADAAKRERKRQWHWCRRPNGFSDMPKWRVVAASLAMPVHQVVALANRLEELANDAANKGYARGEVAHFDPDDFGAALGMTAEDAGRIYAALEERGWVVDGHVADFYDRNKDEEDDTAALRQRRKRVRASVLRQLAQLARLGLIAPVLRNDFEARLPSLDTMADKELFNLSAELDLALSTGAPVTRDAHRDSVTVTVEKITNSSSAAVDNSGTSAAAEAAGSAGQAQSAAEAQAESAELWLKTEAVRIVVLRQDVPRPRAELLIARWRRDLDDNPVATAAILRACDEQGLCDSHFLVTVTGHIKRCRIARERGDALPLPPVGLGAASPQSRRHAVTPAAVDKGAADSAAIPGTGTDG